MRTSNHFFNRILIIGDPFGINVLFRHIDPTIVCGIIGASIRPQYLPDLNKIANSYNIPLIVQPKFKSSNVETEFWWGVVDDLNRVLNSK